MNAPTTEAANSAIVPKGHHAVTPHYEAGSFAEAELETYMAYNTDNTKELGYFPLINLS